MYSQEALSLDGESREVKVNSNSRRKPRGLARPILLTYSSSLVGIVELGSLLLFAPSPPSPYRTAIPLFFRDGMNLTE